MLYSIKVNADMLLQVETSMSYINRHIMNDPKSVLFRKFVDNNNSFPDNTTQKCNGCNYTFITKRAKLDCLLVDKAVMHHVLYIRKEGTCVIVSHICIYF